MQVSQLPLILLLLVVPAGFAQQAGDGSNAGNSGSNGGSNEAPVAAPGGTAPGDDAKSPGQADPPPLRDEYEPRERISRDKAESFPPDI